VVLRTEGGARRAYKVLTSAATRRCLTRIVKDEVQSKASEQGVDVKTEVGTVTGSSSYGDESSGIGLKFTVTKGISVDLFADIVFARVGRTIGLYSHASDSEVDKECGASSTTDCLSFKGLITAATGRLAGGATS
jgi:hypothetical protein